MIFICMVLRYVIMCSCGNLGGRLVWGSVSDVIGRKNQFILFTLVGIHLIICTHQTHGQSMTFFLICYIPESNISLFLCVICRHQAHNV